MIDIITLVASDDIERLTLSNDGTSFLLLEAGRKLPAQSITTHVGGGACNTAVSLARLGWKAKVCARVGKDLNAAAVREHLQANGVEDGLVDALQATGTGVMIASHDRNASIFVHRGANEHLSEADLASMTSIDLVYMAPLSSSSADMFPVIAERGKAAGAMVAANPGIRQLTTRLEAITDTLPKLDLLSVNRVEAEALIPAVLPDVKPQTRVPPHDPQAPPLMTRGLRAAGVRLGLLPFLSAMRGLGPDWISLTDGTDGAYLAGPSGVWFQPTLKAEVAGTAGAGDAFCSTLSASLAAGDAPEDAMLSAATNAASVVEHVDTTSGLLETDNLQTRRSRLVGFTPQQLA